jgi:DNA-binding GntR family transcriptional regulator
MSASSLSKAEKGAIGATTAMRVAADLRRRILHGEFAPGQRLKIDEIAALVDVSHMPVRVALQELEAEGVLDLLPHRGAVVRGVDADFVCNVYDVREAIEGMLTERCAERIDAAGLKRLHAANAAYESAAIDGDTSGLLDANRNIHDAINAAAANPEALRVLGQGRLLIEALRLRFGYGEGRIDTVLAQHAALYRAIAKRDVERAGRLARAHCRAARNDLLALLKR